MLSPQGKFSFQWKPQSQRIYYGTAVDGDGQVIDEVLCLAMLKPKSYTRCEGGSEGRRMGVRETQREQALVSVYADRARTGPQVTAGSSLRSLKLRLPPNACSHSLHSPVSSSAVPAHAATSMHARAREDVLELHTHGGGVCAQRVLRALIEAGARPARPGEFTLRAFLNGRLDLSQVRTVVT
jgi:hypothetical protein